MLFDYRLKNTLKAAGTAITGGPDLPPPPAGYGRAPPQYGSSGMQQTGRPASHQHPQQHGFNKPPPSVQGFGQRVITHSSAPGRGPGGPASAGESAMAGVGGLFGKIKNIFAGDGDEQPGPPRRPPAGPPGYGYGQQAGLGQKPPPPPSSYGHPPGQQPPLPRQGQLPFDDVYSRGSPPPPPPSGQQQQPGPGFRQQQTPPPSGFGEYNERDDPYNRQFQSQPPPNEFQQQPPPPSDLFSGK